jgi:uncharacterized RDD family membrane protein YckC
MLDTIITAETPEGILLELHPAGLSVRFYASALDWAIRLAIMYAAAIGAGFLGGIGIASWLILIFALEWLYPMLFELTPQGSTPGKRAFGLKVVMDNGLPITPAAAVTRNLLRAADFLPFVYGFGIVSILVRRDAKRLGDLAAATTVVHESRAVRTIVLDDVPPVVPAKLLSPRDQAAVIALAARASTLTTERLDELAAMAASVSGDDGRTGRAVTTRVLGVALWFLGRR